MIPCNVCSSTSFEEKDGFLFCTSCCTQSQNYVGMEVEADGHNVNKTILKDQIKKEISELTTWEEYNYVLVGLVNQLIELGAKEDVKLTTLQLWTEYLRKSEAAFFSKQEYELPRLPILYKEKDAILMYNKAKTSRVNKSRRKQNTKLMSAKLQRKRQKEIIELEYKTTTGSTWGSSTNQSIPVPIKFTRKARRYLKKIMPKQHIKEHAEYVTRPECHKILVKDNTEIKVQHLGPRIIVSLLYIALNHVNDKIQLGDIIRWIREGHLSMMNIERFFPEKYKFSARMVEQMCQTAVVPHHRLRYHIFFVMQLMKIEKLNRPDFTVLCRRYVTELGLPDAVFKYAERLIRLNPPKMKMPQTFNSTFIPNYEGRAMAYIVFVIKLIFGLDGTTEELLSDSAEKVNCKIGIQKLFNFRNWMHLIDLRKTILSEYHFPIKLTTSTTLDNNSHQFINHLNLIQTPETIINNVGNRLKPLFEAMLKVADIHQVYLDKKIKDKSFKFHPSLTPNSDYLYQLNEQSVIDISKLLNENSQHSEFDVYLKKNALCRDLREKYGISLKFCKINRSLINMNKNLSKHIIQRGNEEIINKYSSQKGFVEVIFKRQKLTNLDRLIENEIQIALNRFHSPRKKQIEANLNLVVEHAKVLVNENNHAFEYEPVEGNITDSETGQSEETSDSETEPELVFENIRQENDERDLESNLRMFDNQSEDELSDNDWNDVEEEIEFFIPNFHYWRRICYTHHKFGEQRYEKVERELPNSFNWLMRECARIIENKPRDLYIELLTIEAGFISLMKPLRKNTTRLKFRNWKKPGKPLPPVLKYFDSLRHNL